MMPILNIIRKCQRDGRYGRYRRPSGEQTKRDIRPAHLSHPLYYRLLLESAQAGDTSRKHPGTLHSCWDNAPPQRNTTLNRYTTSPCSSTLLNASTPCLSASAYHHPNMPQAMHRRLPLKSAQSTTTATPSCAET